MRQKDAKEEGREGELSERKSVREVNGGEGEMEGKRSREE